jgi:Zn-dependent peptidase ImmA (M78 family)/transcriptional regulator with XRE-family HTH domain
MDTGIGSRVARLLPTDCTHREIASRVGMTPDALSRSLNGQRGFAAIELARLADVLDAEVHYLITGQPDPRGIRVAARHNYDPTSGRRDVPGAAGDKQAINDVALAYQQAEAVGMNASEVPASTDELLAQLGDGFVRPFMSRLEACGVDVVRLSGVSTSYCLTIAGRAVIIVPATGNWFWENWCLAHELGHLARRHVDPGLPAADQSRHEAAANAFAADLLLPAAAMRAIDWADITTAQLAGRVWELGVSTEALAKRLSSLHITTSPVVGEWAVQPTQRLLRRWWTPNEPGDPITERMDAASTRHFPLALQEAHLALIANGELPKATLAWMLGVEADSLEVDEPAPTSAPSSNELAAALGL